MGRKIPSKKHRGVKDPYAQHALRLQKVAGVVDAPPADPDHQPAPRSLRTLFPLPTTYRRGSNGGGKSQPAVGKFLVSRLSGEGGRAFSLRIGRAVRALHHDNDQYPESELDEEEDAKGERMAAWRARRRAKARRGEGAETGGRGAMRERGTKAQRRARLAKEKRDRAAEARQSSALASPQYERVPFGDLAHAPPALTLPHNKGFRRGLLLSSKAAGRGAALEAAGRGAALEAAGRGAALEAAGRGAALEAAGRGAALEAARLQAVAAYRALKRHRLTQKTHLPIS